MNNKGRFKKGHIPHNKVSPKVKCIICGKIFTTKPCYIRKGHPKYCSMKCYGISKRGKTKIPLMTKCIICGKEFRTYPSIIKRGRSKYCSRKCFAISRKDWIPWNKGKKHPAVTGDKNPKWKGGKFIRKKYFYVLSPKHPFATKQGYILEHRLVMEKHIGRYLLKKEIVHHIDSNTFNNHINNLMLFPNSSAHRIFHSVKH